MKEIYKNIINKYSKSKDYNDIFNKYKISYYDDYDNYTWITKQEKNTYPLSVKDVVENYSPEELIDAIGLDKVEMILRKKKLEKLKTKIK